MPYIRPSRREAILERVIEHDRMVRKVIIEEVTNSGELNFAITQIISDYFTSTTQDYRSINDILGALEGAKNEFYRRVAVPFEERKIKENGDVYPEKKD